jgi:hypothetical protein
VPALCRIHHAAFDANILGVEADKRVHIRDDVLAEHDGPMLKHGLQEMDGRLLVVPRDSRLQATRVASFLSDPPRASKIIDAEFILTTNQPDFGLLKKGVMDGPRCALLRWTVWGRDAYYAIARARSFLVAPEAKLARTRRSSDTLGSPASIFATRDWLEPRRSASAV